MTSFKAKVQKKTKMKQLNKYLCIHMTREQNKKHKVTTVYANGGKLLRLESTAISAVVLI